MIEESALVLQVCMDAGYEFAALDEPSARRMQDYTPCDILYKLYLAHANRHVQAYRSSPVLTRTQFGVALNAACDGNLPVKQLRVRDQQGVTRRVRVYGGVRGPNSFRRRPIRGRPKRED